LGGHPNFRLKKSAEPAALNNTSPGTGSLRRNLLLMQRSFLFHLSQAAPTAAPARIPDANWDFLSIPAQADQFRL
jgi:hypothetical protein